MFEFGKDKNIREIHINQQYHLYSNCSPFHSKILVRALIIRDLDCSSCPCGKRIGPFLWFFISSFFCPLDNNIDIIVILTSKELQLWQWRVKWNWGEVAKVNSCAADGNQWVTNTKLGYPRTTKINTKQSSFKKWRTNICYSGEHEQRWKEFKQNFFARIKFSEF